MNEIGGYFGLELNDGGQRYHDTPYVLKSGRASLCGILAHLSPSLVYIPFYTCDALLEAFTATSIPYRYYALNDKLEPAQLPGLGPGEYFLYINYFGLKDDVVADLSARYTDRFIADCTQAFFTKWNGISWYFNSCRKFFGVPDGSYLYAPAGTTLTIPAERNENYITDHLVARFNGHTSWGYQYFNRNEELAGQGIAAMSLLSERLLSHVDYNSVIEKRRENYEYLHSRFGAANTFDAALPLQAVPMCYPLLPAGGLPGKQQLAASGVFIPSFWRDTLHRSVDGFLLEKQCSEQLYPLPVDHRYSVADMERMATLIQLADNAGD